MKSDIEVRRSRNEHGTLTWQLGEIWPTGGWGSLEYGTVGWLDGQVLGGRWKPLHHVMEQHLYRDVVAICGADALCFVKNSNALHAADGHLSAVLFDLHTQKEVEVSSVAVSVPPGPSSQRFCLGEPDLSQDCTPYSSILAAHQCSASSCVLVLRLRVQPSLFLSFSEENVVFIVPPANMSIPATNVSFKVSQPHSCIMHPDRICSTVTPPPCIRLISTLTCPTGFSDCFLVPCLVRVSHYQGTGQISSKRSVSRCRRAHGRISARGQASRLAAAGFYQSRASAHVPLIVTPGVASVVVRIGLLCCPWCLCRRDC